jgi:hypothetical protein
VALAHQYEANGRHTVAALGGWTSLFKATPAGRGGRGRAGIDPKWLVLAGPPQRLAAREPLSSAYRQQPRARRRPVPPPLWSTTPAS